MVERNIIVSNPSGLHARPAAKLVEFARKYDGKVEIIKGEKTANPKSILMLLSLGAMKGEQVTLRVTGRGEQAFLEKLADFIADLDG